MVAFPKVLSEILSSVTISVSLLLKIPQIFHLLKFQESEGLSLKGLLLEVSSYTVTVMYNYTNKYDLFTYLEYPIILVQEHILIGLLMHFKKYKLSSILLLFGLYGAISLAFVYNLLNKFILTLLLPLTIPVCAISKIMQLLEIISKKNADSVSLLTWFLSLFTSLSRIYTTYVGSGDINLLLNFSVSSVLSGAVLGAALYFQRLSRPKVN